MTRTRISKNSADILCGYHLDVLKKDDSKGIPPLYSVAVLYSLYNVLYIPPADPGSKVNDAI